MNLQSWNNILTVMSVMVLADERVYKEEVDCLVGSMIKLRDILGPELLLTEGMVFDWFQAHRDEIKQRIKAPDAEVYILRAIMALTDMPGRKRILAEMHDIAISDKDYHKKEHDVCALAAAHWGVANPGAESAK